MKNTDITLSKAYKEIRELIEKTNPNRKAFYDAGKRLRNQAIALSSILEAFESEKGLGIVKLEFSAREPEYKYLSESTAEQITQDLNRYSPETLHVDNLELNQNSYDAKPLKITVSIV